MRKPRNGVTQVNLGPTCACYAHSVPVGGTDLPTYRLYRLDGAGRISAAEWIEAASDDDARARARAEHAPGGFELWERNRLVERVIGLDK